MKFLPGVSVEYFANNIVGVSVRGFDATSTEIRFDGLPTASASTATLGTGNRDRNFEMMGASSADISRVEVRLLRTPEDSANAIGGSINMITKSGFNRRTPQFSYNTFLTLQAKGTQGNLPPFFHDFAGTDARTTMRPVQPGFDLNYLLPLNPSLAFTFNLAHNARYQDREYQLATWDRVRLLQTAGSMNSVINIFTKDLAAVGADWRMGKSVVRARIDSTLQNSYARSGVFSYSFGSGATGGPNHTDGAATGVGSVGQTSGNHLNQYRRLINGRFSYSYGGDHWKFDARASYSESRRTFSDMEDGFFYTVATTLSNVLVSAQGLDGITDVRSRRGYLLAAELPEDKVRSFARAVLCDPVIDQFVVHAPGAPARPGRGQPRQGDCANGGMAYGCHGTAGEL